MYEHYGTVYQGLHDQNFQDHLKFNHHAKFKKKRTPRKHYLKHI